MSYSNNRTSPQADIQMEQLRQSIQDISTGNYRSPPRTTPSSDFSNATCSGAIVTSGVGVILACVNLAEACQHADLTNRFLTGFSIPSDIVLALFALIRCLSIDHRKKSDRICSYIGDVIVVLGSLVFSIFKTKRYYDIGQCDGLRGVKSSTTSSNDKRAAVIIIPSTPRLPCHIWQAQVAFEFIAIFLMLLTVVIYEIRMYRFNKKNNAIGIEQSA